MAVTVYGSPGQSIRGAGRFRDDARRGAFFEGITGRALERWLARRPGDFHLFHDLTGFQSVSGHGYGKMSLGAGNIDHVILGGAAWLMVDAKGTGAGTLTVDDQGHGVLVRPDGSTKPQPWLDSLAFYSAMGVLVRLTGLKGFPAWLVPDVTTLADELDDARCFSRGGARWNFRDIESGGLADDMAAAGLDEPLSGRPAPSEAVAVLAAHTAPGPARRLTGYPGSPDLVELPVG